MKIINLDSKYDLTPSQIAFVETVFELGNPLDPSDQAYMKSLIGRIPIFLISKEKMPKYIPLYPEDPMEEWPESKPSTEVLGFYQHESKILNISDIPVIGLCLERIQRCVRDEWEYTVLIAKVIIHEFAHALMHPIDKQYDYGRMDEFYKWIEEASANAITLAYMENYQASVDSNPNRFLNAQKTLSAFEFTERFIEMQPDNYAMGLDFHKNKFPLWKDWRFAKAEIKKLKATKTKWLNTIKPFQLYYSYNKGLQPLMSMFEFGLYRANAKRNKVGVIK